MTLESQRGAPPIHLPPQLLQSAVCRVTSPNRSCFLSCRRKKKSLTLLLSLACPKYMTNKPDSRSLARAQTSLCPYAGGTLSGRGGGAAISSSWHSIKRRWRITPPTTATTSDMLQLLEINGILKDQGSSFGWSRTSGPSKSDIP